jgi:triacylglycerol lipase
LAGTQDKADYGQVFAALSPQRRRLMFTLLAAALAVATVAVTMVIRAVDSEAVDPVPQGSPGPVLLVPGYGGDTADLDALAATLRAKGRLAEVVALAGNGTGDLREEARQLSVAARRALARTSADSVDVVGYSAGGVVARLWVRDFGGANLARRILALGSPQHGTTVAGLASDIVPTQCPIACQQLIPDSDLLRGLNAGDETPDGPRFISIWSTTDDVVQPPDSARLDGAVNITVQHICPGYHLRHGDLPTDPTVISVISAELSAQPPFLPSRQSCRRLSS